MSAAENLAAALELASAGLPVFPAIVTRNQQTRRWDKKPAIDGWRAAATTDREQIKQWWNKFSGAVPGIELGRVGLIVIDADRHGGPDGVAAFIGLEKQSRDCDVEIVPQPKRLVVAVTISTNNLTRASRWGTVRATSLRVSTCEVWAAGSLRLVRCAQTAPDGNR